MVRFYNHEAIPAIHNIADIPVRSGDGVEQRVFRGNDQIVSFSSFEPHAAAKRHDHPWEQITHVLDGTGTVVIDDDAAVITAGDIFLVPPTVPHYVTTDDQPCDLLTIHPLREDKLHLTEYQQEFR